MSDLSLNKRNEKRQSAHKSQSDKVCKNYSYHVSQTIGKFFYKLGFFVAENPKLTICLSFLTAALCCLGFLNFYQERDPLKLWVPSNSEFLVNTKFIMKEFSEGIRTQNVLIVADDVLQPEVMRKLDIISKEIQNIKVSGETGEEIDLNKLCFQIPLIAQFTVTDDDNEIRHREKRSEFNDNFFEDDKNNELKKILQPFMNMNMQQYCAIVDSLPKGCMRENFLELWKSNSEKIDTLTKNDILAKLNKSEVSPETGHVATFISMLGETQTDADGLIISAKSLFSSWMLHINFSEVESNKLGNMAGTEDWATFNTLAFESKFLEVMERLKKELESDDFKVYFGAGRSYGDISSKTLFQDIDKLCLGVLLMMIYMVIVLSKYSWVELRFLLTSIGLFNVTLAYFSGCGLSSLLFSYSPVHTSLFFIVLGLGVDDIFVIMASLRKVNDEFPKLELSVKIAKTLERAGASITITSLTDILAFLVGGTTVLPSLKSFCIFAGLSILMTYIYVVTFFVAFLTLDEKRLAKNKNGAIPCITHKDRKLWCEPKLLPRFITFLYSKLILNKVGKSLVILAALALTAFSTERVFRIKQKFDPMWFIPSHNQFFQHVMKHREFYPNRGFEAGVYFGNLNYTAELPKIISLADDVKNQTHILSHVTAWTDAFQEYVEEFHKIDVKKIQLTDAQFKVYVSNFLFSSMGGQFQANFKFEGNLTCGQPAGEVKISSITFNYHKFDDRDEYLPAKKRIEEIIAKAKIDGKVFLWGKIFANWITDEIIDAEIFRNISLALVGVFACTALMIVNIQVCLYIFLCVLMSLVSVGGFMQLWGLNLDLVTCISLQLSVGLCIDCAAHIGHQFLHIKEGDGNARALKTVENIGGAVWQGGGSTMLAVSLLAFSDAYTYQTFFKVFTIVIIFALFFGTFFLPVILSICSPKPYETEIQNEDTELTNLEKSEVSELIKANDKIKSDCDNNEIS